MNRTNIKIINEMTENGALNFLLAKFLRRSVEEGSKANLHFFQDKKLFVDKNKLKKQSYIIANYLMAYYILAFEFKETEISIKTEQPDFFLDDFNVNMSPISQLKLGTLTDDMSPIIELIRKTSIKNKNGNGESQSPNSKSSGDNESSFAFSSSSSSTTVSMNQNTTLK